MVEKMKYFYDTLLRQYPSGMNIQRVIIGKMLKVDDNYVLAGNGAAEFISALGDLIKGSLLLNIPTFNEYLRCFTNCNIITINTKDDDFKYNKSKILQKIPESNCIAIINPDNPSGSFLGYSEIIEIIETCESNNVMCIVDESFIDFADRSIRYTLIENKILKKYRQLIVLKSISKSYGVPGLRLGVMATSNSNILAEVRKKLSVWNINSMAEYFLQIEPLFAWEYKAACDKIEQQRYWLTNELKKINFLKVYDSQANYIMCQVTEKYTSSELATILLKRHDILLKDLSDKDGFEKMKYLRIAVRDEKDNQQLISALNEL